MKLHVATARPIGERCRAWAEEQGYQLVPMDECEIFISVLYDKILPASFLEGRRCYNFHPGILPQYRGAGAFSWAILNGEKETGITLHEIDGDIDHGPIIDIIRMPISAKDTAESLYIDACENLLYAFKVWLPLLLECTPPSAPQDESRARFYPRKALQEARDISRIARAFHFPGKEQAYYLNSHGEKIPITYE